MQLKRYSNFNNKNVKFKRFWYSHKLINNYRIDDKYKKRIFKSICDIAKKWIEKSEWIDIFCDISNFIYIALLFLFLILVLINY